MTGIKWPEGAEANIDGDYTKWVDGNEYNLEGEGWVNEGWVKSENSWSLDEYRSDGDFKVIERPIETVDPIEIKEVSKPIDTPYVPKVGDRCEHANPQFAAHYGKLSYIGLSRGGAMIMESEGSDLLRFSAGAVFRPVKTELEEFIEKAAKVLQKDDQDVTGLCNKDVKMFHSAAKALLAAGFKAPE